VLTALGQMLSTRTITAMAVPQASIWKSDVLSDLGFNKTLDLLTTWQLELILRDEEPVVHVGERVFYERMIHAGAEKNANRRIVASDHHVPRESRYRSSRAFTRCLG
jgi:hypothetical protein